MRTSKLENLFNNKKEKPGYIENQQNENIIQKPEKEGLSEDINLPKDAGGNPILPESED